MTQASKIFLLGILLQATSLQAQSPVQALQQNAANSIQEKIYAHIGQESYLTGEILWFKLYAVDATQHLLLDLSKVAYIEILDRTNQPVLQTKVELSGGLGKGSLYLPATLITGHYNFRAYTNWMKNQGAEFFFQRSIHIINTLKAGEENQRVTTSSIQVEIFPEGGQLAAGVKNRVAFKVSDDNGTGLTARVVVLNNRNDTIVKSQTLKNGIGRFEFTPVQGEPYTVLAFDQSFRKARNKLPLAEPLGYGMMVTDSAEYLKVSIRGKFLQPNLTLIAHTRQSIKFASVKDNSNGFVVFELEKSKLGEGISHLTVFNTNNQPVCERLYFKKPKASQLDVRTNQQEYNIRRKATLNLNSNTETGEYSVSIFRADSIANTSTIVTNLLLTSDLVGYVEQPEFYFSDDANATLAADNLMLTHGWRRFSWKSLSTTQEVKYLPEVRGHLIQGKIVDNTGNGIGGKAGYLASPGKKIRIYTALSNASGTIRFQMKNFLTEEKLFAQTDYLKDSLLHLEVENPYFNQYEAWRAKELKLTNQNENSLVARSIGMQVQDIFSEDETYFNFVKQDFDSIPFYGKPDETYLLNDYTRFPVMEEIIREYVKSVWVRKNKNNFRLRVVDRQSNNLFKENPLVLVDGVPVFDINQVMEFDPLKIKRLDVLSRKYYLGPVEFPGIISFSTYNGDLGGFTLDSRSITINYEGLQQQREFYSPKFDKPNTRSSRVPDQRYQVYWNPSVKLQAGKETTLDFYTSDVEGKFFVVIEGLSGTGKPASGKYSFSVSR
jgi:hypothetical protein